MAANLGMDFEAEAIADAGIALSVATKAAVAAAVPVATAFVQESGSYGAILSLVASHLPRAGGELVRQLAFAAVLAAKKHMKADGTSASRSTTMVKKRSRESSVPTLAAQVEPPLRLAALGVTPKLKSVWASLRDSVNAKRRIKNDFSFKLSSNLDQRGVIAIPLRHDGAMELSLTSSDGYNVGIQGTKLTAATSQYPQYESNLVTINGIPSLTSPSKSRSLIVPRLNLPTLEDCSWNLNKMKLVVSDMGHKGVKYDANNDAQPTLEPILQLGGGFMPYDSNEDPLYDIVHPRNSNARLQEQAWRGLLPAELSMKSFPKFKTQLRGGTFKMRCVNQGMDRTTVEYVVLKVKDPVIGLQSKDSPEVTSTQATQFSADTVWKTLYETVGYEHARRVNMNGGYAMGLTNQPDVNQNGQTAQNDDKLKKEAIMSPYHTWLPSNCFKSKYPVFKDAELSNGGSGLQNPPTSNNSSGFDANYNQQGGSFANDAKFGLNTSTAHNVILNQDITIGSGGQPTPFRVAGRGHCTIKAGGERTVTIPLPGSLYDASRLTSTATLQQPDSDRCAFSDESYVVLMSVNGAMTDMILPGKAAAGEVSDLVKVIGQAYAPTTVDFYCSYTENVAPCHCDYSQVPVTQYNLGQSRNPMLPGDTAAYPGRILSMSNVQPISTNGVVRTGDENRAADN